MNSVFKPIAIGDYVLPNRVIMAPMTRARAGEEGVPNDLMADYYQQRASAGLIIAEATAVNRQGDGWPGAPGIYTKTQIDGWRNVANAVHQRGGRIFVQLWHMGRTVLPEYIDGNQPVAPSAIAAKGTTQGKDRNQKPFVVPRALSKKEIAAIVFDFVTAARNAIDAGLDGVEIHAANNYLIDSFLRDGTNTRTDEYGGSAENRARFLLEIIDRISAEIGAAHVGVRLSPTNGVYGISDSDPQTTFVTVAKLLDQAGIAYLHVLEPPKGIEHPMTSDLQKVTPAIRRAYGGTLILNGGFDAESANVAIDQDNGDAVAFGVPFIANPNLVERWKAGLALASPNPDLFYTPGPEGYADYPISIAA